MNLEELQETFSLNEANNSLCFKLGEGNIALIEIQNSHATALVSMQGAHVLSWIPAGEDEVIWLSKEARFAAGKSVRGGIPICWPWFGAHETNNHFPAHGFARTTDWHVLSTEALDDGATRINFTTEPSIETEAMWPANTTVQYQLTVGKKLELELITHNNGLQPITISQALHTYFNVGNIEQVKVHGLDDTDYLDKPDGFKRKRQHGPIVIDDEVDRVYLDTATDCVIEDNVLKRNIIIIKCGSHSTVVWNPGKDIAETMGDLGVDGYKRMLCLESSNAAEDKVIIDAGKVHQLWVQYEVQHSE